MKQEIVIKLTIKSSLESVEFVGCAIRAIALACHLSETLASHFELCVVEAVNNSIKHAYNFHRGETIDVVVYKKQESLQVDVIDTGCGMKEPLKTITLNIDPNDIQNIPESGYGIYLMQQLMDDVRYKTENGRNTLSMIKKISSADLAKPASLPAKAALPAPKNLAPHYFGDSHNE